MVDGITSANGTSSVFNAPGLRPVDPATQQGQRAQVGRSAEQDGQLQGDTRQTLNTAPTEEQRQQALSTGQSRGSFVDIQA